jgi:integrase
MFWEMVEWQRNPMQLVQIKGISKRQKKPMLLTVEQNINLENLSMRVVRAVVHRRVRIVKTEYSEDDLPLDPDFAVILLGWKCRSEEETRKTNSKVASKALRSE